MDITVNYTADQLKQQMLATLTSRMSSMKLKKTVNPEDLKLEAKVGGSGDNSVGTYLLEELKITISLPD